MSGALHGLRVIDLSHMVAGPYCARLLAGLGADVVKAEPPDGDLARRVGSFPANAADSERSALFLFLNQGKLGLTFDPAQQSDLKRLHDLLRRADVCIFDAGEARRWAASYERVSDVNPGLILASIANFGETGPLRSYRSIDMLACAMGGLMYANGEPEREPLRPPGWQASYLAGTAAAIGILLALAYRSRTGRGQRVAVSLVEAVMGALEGALSSAAAGDPIRVRRGNRQRVDYPLMLLPCRDGHVVVSVTNDADWEVFGYLVGDERLRSQPFMTPEGREAHAEELEELLVHWLRGIDRNDFFNKAAVQWRLPCASVMRTEELFSDGQHQARHYFVEIDHPVVGRLRYPGPPFRLPASPWSVRRAPLLGEHNARLSGLWQEHRAPIVVDQFSGGPPLAGVRVLDLTAMWAGPLCTRILADAGAQVIKIELASRPDGTRRSARRDGSGLSPFFAELNRNKRGVTLDLRTDADRERFRSLVKISDLVVENFSPRVMKNLGLQYDALRELKEDIVLLSMPAYGNTGPYRNAVAFGSAVEAMAGFAALAGYHDGPPQIMGVAYADPVAGLHGAVAALAALEHRRRTGKGQHVELAQRETLTQVFGEVIVAFAMGASPQRQGNRHSAMAPHGCYRALGDDRWIAIAVEDDEQWQRLATLIGGRELAEESRFASFSARQANHAALDKIITMWTQCCDQRTAAQTLQEAGVAAAPVLDAAALLEDEALTSLGFIHRYSDGHAQPGFVCRLGASPGIIERPAPMLGEHDEWLETLLATNRQ